MTRILEICCDTMQSVINANLSGADRIELCTALQTGGLTPTLSFIREAVKISKIPINVLLRPRAGSFVYSDYDFNIMCSDIQDIKSTGAAGIVSGALLADGRIDKEKTLKMIKLSNPLGFTFHRAIDFCTDVDDAINFLCENGAERVLTSGGGPKINAGLEQIIRLHNVYGKKILVMPGGGLNEDNATLLSKAGIMEFHLSASEFVQENITYSRRPDGLGHVFADNDYGYNFSSVIKIGKILKILR